MAIVVENGEGLSTAVAFIDVAYFKEYHDARGGDYSAMTPDEKIEQAIVRATDYINRRFGSRFVGTQLNSDQALSWPRSDAYYPDGREALLVPREIKAATAEYALRAATISLAPDPLYDSSNGSIVEREERAGPIVERYKFGGDGMVSSFHKYPLADALLVDLITGQSELLRA